jgi:hypothetical protein
MFERIEIETAIFDGSDLRLITAIKSGSAGRRMFTKLLPSKAPQGVYTQTTAPTEVLQALNALDAR